MVVRTISQLPSLPVTEMTDDDIIEVSHKVVGNDRSYFESRKASSKDFKDSIYSELSNKIVIDHNMKHSDGSNVNISALYQYAHGIQNVSSYTLAGPREFSNGLPYSRTNVEDTVSKGINEDYIIPNIKHIRNMINDEQIIFMSTGGSKLMGGNPFDTAGRPLYEKHEQDQDHFYYWKIDDGQTDSSMRSYDEYSFTRDPYEEIEETGNLVVWGWLADNGHVDAQYAWVGLFAQMNYGNNQPNQTTTTPNSVQTNDPWIPIQIKPWIRGENANVMQYIGFNAPVKKGLRLKIRTGFAVNGKTGGDKNAVGSLTFSDTWSPNSFFGYVIK